MVTVLSRLPQHLEHVATQASNHEETSDVASVRRALDEPSLGLAKIAIGNIGRTPVWLADEGGRIMRERGRTAC